MLEVQNIHLRFPGHTQNVLDSISLKVAPQDFIIVLGSNGSGKSSLLKVITGAYQPTKGRIKYGSSLTPLAQKRLPLTNMAFLTQDTRDSLFHDMTVLENACLNDLKTQRASFRTSTDTEKNFYQRHLQPYNPKLPEKMDTRVTDLSGGEKQSLALGLALRHHPQLLLLDEHTSALDPKTAQDIMRITAYTIATQKLTALMTTHNVADALQYGNRLIALRDGKIIMDVKGAQKDQLRREDLLPIYG